MNTHAKRTRNHDHSTELADDTRALLEATANVTEEAVVEARHRLKRALDAAGEAYGEMRDKAIEGAKTADEVVRANPYQAIAVALGVGALLGFFLSRRNRD